MKFKKENGTSKMEVDNAKTGTKKSKNFKKQKGNAKMQVVNAIKAETGADKNNSTMKLKKNMNAKVQVDNVKSEPGSQMNNRKRKSTEALSEVKPKMMKVEEVSSPFANSKKRQMRKKKVVAASAVLAKADAKVPDNAKLELSIDYLKLWKNDRPAWKFSKLRQMWLNDHMLDVKKVSDEMFPVYLEYMNGSAKRQKQYVVKKAEDLLKELEKDDSEADTTDKKYDRARKIIQSLDSEDSD